MWRRFVTIATVIFGIVPATFTLLANALYYWNITAIPEGAVVDVAWGQVALLGLIGAAGVLGYVALFFAARARMSGRVAIGLLLGVIAMVSAIALALTPYWLGLPVIVGLGHIVGYLRRGRAPGG
jgi:hypothetical protein